MVLSVKTLAALVVAGAVACSASPVEKRGFPTKLGGVNLAGYDFGTDTSGSYSGGAFMTSTVGNQITTFKNAGANAFRLPFSAQWISASNIAQLDPTALAAYKSLVTQVTNTGSYAIIDMHNYARWNGGIFGQGGPSNAQFANLWSLIAKQFAGNSKVIFGIMNEPHDLSMSTWATTVQAAVTAIRQAGATSQYMLLPGTIFSHCDQFVSGANDPLLNVKDSDGTTSKLLFDIHQYLDSDGSGTHTTCTTNAVSALTACNSWMASHGRQALLTETGSSSDSSCVNNLKQELAYVKGSSNLMGFTAWSAGSFDSSYVLSLTPTNNGLTLSTLSQQAVVPNFP